MSETQRINTLGLGEKDLSLLLAQLERSSPFPGEGAGRTYARWAFQNESVPVTILQPGGSAMRTRMACRNLSQGGIGLLHRSYAHIGASCVVTLPHPDRGELEVNGRIARCLHFSGMVHEIGVTFDREISVRDIVRPHPMQEIFAIEQVDPMALIGTLLLIDESELDTNLVRHFLRGTQVRIIHAASLGAAEAFVREELGMVLSEARLWGEDGGDFAKLLVERGHGAPPIVMTSAERSMATYQIVTQPNVKGFLAKPFVQENLLRTVGEFMRRPSVERVRPSGDVQTADPSFIKQMMPELVKACASLREAAERDDPTMALSVVMQISGVAPVLGLDELAGITSVAGQRLAETMDLGWVLTRIDEIERLCSEAAA